MLDNMLEQVGINNYIYLSILLFTVGAIGILYRRSTIVMLMSVELMLAAANMLLTVFSVYHQDTSGQVFVIFSMAVAAAEVAVGLAILVAVFRNIGTTDIDKLKNLKG
ncbi:NADH-quinone oxidoreductase subunit NuoK [Dysgonomonas sp. 511]|uniref:NADH-quinone oxidoreductase subunit NuoK n=1 Tax=Dysgonomonas sp. 511 TaxID=2302930 RepID=UPI0013CFE530|nr:NADH-quinone oxidoreductase subunit NuoK [Dysgonomonas sp. 511]NDV77800.1 NADH-quinone oxidoreductase subunit NuoK [Dysgonomonas sp. 511]